MVERAEEVSGRNCGRVWRGLLVRQACRWWHGSCVAGAIVQRGFQPVEVCLCPTMQALNKAAKLAKRGGTAVHAYRLLAQMKQGLGDHLGAVRGSYCHAS